MLTTEKHQVRRHMGGGLKALLFATLLLLPWDAFGEVWIPWVTVDDPGNPPDLVNTSPWSSFKADDGSWDTMPAAGGVPYTFEIARKPISIAQYVEFLNAIAADDPNQVVGGLHRPFSKQVFEWPAFIIRRGQRGTYTYKAAPGFEDYTAAVHPYSAMRFANWMHNGQPTGPQGPRTTESGAYDCVSGRVKTPPADCVFPHMAGATFRLPTLSESHKAGYWNTQTQRYHHWPTGLGVRDREDKPISCSPNTESCKRADKGNQVNRSGDAWCGSTQTDADGELFTVGCEHMPTGSYPETRTPFGALDFCGAYPVVTEQMGESSRRPNLNRIITHPTGWWGHAVGDCEVDKIGGVALRTWTGRLTGSQMQIRLVKPPPEEYWRCGLLGIEILPVLALAAWSRRARRSTRSIPASSEVTR